MFSAYRPRVYSGAVLHAYPRSTGVSMTAVLICQRRPLVFAVPVTKPHNRNDDGGVGRGGGNAVDTAAGASHIPRLWSRRGQHLLSLIAILNSKLERRRRRCRTKGRPGEIPERQMSYEITTIIV